ncbi:MAG TPA: DUF3301 domain-containing protein [Halothiobacillus sp.]|nr:DUF3301 domain-containing protein [Halothiobacillus sp.]
MISLKSLIVLILLAVIGWVWWRHNRAREKALRIAKEACVSAGVQMLDQSVSLVRIRPKRGIDGRWVLEREFRFEFSRTGADRWSGSVRLMGLRLMGVNLNLVRPVE